MWASKRHTVLKLPQSHPRCMWVTSVLTLSVQRSTLAVGTVPRPCTAGFGTWLDAANTHRHHVSMCRHLPAAAMERFTTLLKAGGVMYKHEVQTYVTTPHLYPGAGCASKWQAGVIRHGGAGCSPTTRPQTWCRGRCVLTRC